MDDADDVVDGAVADDQSRVSGVADGGGDVALGVGAVDPGELVAGGHDGADGLVGQAEETLDHVALLGFEHAVLGALGEDGLELLFGDALALLVAEAEEAEDGVRGAAEDPDDRGADAGHLLEPGGDEDGDAFGVAEGGAFGDEFADDEGEVGRRDDDGGEGQGGGEGGQGGEGVQPVLKVLGDAGAAEDAGQDADEGDADLDGGEEALGVVGKGEGDGGAADALALEDGEAGAAEGDEGELAHREDAVDEDQQQDDDDLEAQVHGGGLTANSRLAGSNWHMPC